MHGSGNDGKVMGFFRRYKLSDYTIAECKEEMSQLAYDASGANSYEQMESYMEQWACFRELLARHEKANKSPLDK